MLLILDGNDIQQTPEGTACTSFEAQTQQKQTINFSTFLLELSQYYRFFYKK